MIKDQSHILAKRYAHAFLNVFYDQISRADSAAFERVGNFLHDNPRILFFFKISVIPDEKKRFIVTQWLKDEKIPSHVNNLIELLIVQKRLSLLGLICVYIASLYKEQQGIMEITVRASHEVTQEQQKMVEQLCAHQMPEKKLEYTYVRDPRLLVGLAITSQTMRWERSLRKLLQNIRLSYPL